MANLKFYRKNSTTSVSSPEQGAILFNTTDRSINVYNGTSWEAYSGVLDAVIDGDALKLTKADGSVVTFDFSDVASASAMATELSNLKTSLGTADDTANKGGSVYARIAALVDEVDSLSGGAGSVADQIANALDGLDLNDAAVEGKYVSAVKQENGQITVERADLPDYSEVYDAKGAAAQALIDAQAYTDGKVDGKFDAVGSAAAALGEAKSYTDGKISELSESVSANATAIAGNTAAINSILGNEDETNLNSIAELAAWINEHGTQAEGFATAIGENKTAIEKEVGDREAAIEAEIERANDAYATATQGALADTAVQSVVTGIANGSISVDGTDVPVKGLGSAAYTDSTAYISSVAYEDDINDVILSASVEAGKLTITLHATPEIDAEVADDADVPTSKAVVDYVSSQLSWVEFE